MSTEVTCTRRWYSIYSNCSCPPCKLMRARAKKRNTCGITNPRISAQEARNIIAGFLARDWTPEAVASATGITPRYARQLLTWVSEGATPNVGPAVAHAIANHKQPTRGYVTATGARRKTRALAYIGHSNQAVADKAGLAMNTTAKIRVGDTRRIKPAVADKIDVAWKALWMTPGASVESRHIAITNGWASPMHWADIDNPQCEPEQLTCAPLTDKERRDAIHYHASLGMRPEEIAREVPCQIATVLRELGEEAA